MNIENIWVEYRARIKAFLHSKVSNSADVEDLLQDILIKVFNNIDTLKDQSKVQSWMFQIAQNAIIDFYRKKGRMQNVHPDDLWYNQDEPETKHALEACVEPFIAALPAETAQMLNAIDVLGQSQKEYAHEHGLSYSTLKSRVQNGRKELRDMFTNCCHISMDKRGNVIDYRSKSDNCDNC